MGVKNLINDKKGLQFTKLFVSLVILSMVIIAVGLNMGEWNSKYNSGIDYDLDDYNQLNELKTEAGTQSDRITPKDSDPSSGDFEGEIFSGGYGILGRIFTPFTLVFNMLQSIEERFALPSFIAEGIIAMLFFVLIFAIIAIVFRIGRTQV